VNFFYAHTRRGVFHTWIQDIQLLSANVTEKWDCGYVIRELDKNAQRIQEEAIPALMFIRKLHRSGNLFIPFASSQTIIPAG
jgi:hypothetical protein